MLCWVWASWEVLYNKVLAAWKDLEQQCDSTQFLPRWVATLNNEIPLQNEWIKPFLMAINNLCPKTTINILQVAVIY